MSQQCQYGRCYLHGEDHSKCSQGSCSCCCCHNHKVQEDTCHFSEQLLELADEAWMELLKEKIKAQIEAYSGKRLDELAKLVNEANHTRWHNIFAEKRSEEGYKNKLREFFHQPDNAPKKR